MNAVDLCRCCGDELGDDDYPLCKACHRDENEDQDEDDCGCDDDECECDDDADE